MNIETLIQGNTNSITELTEAVIKLTTALAQRLNSVPSEPVKETIWLDEPTKAPDLDYPTVRALISSLALTHRDEIKALNKKYSLSVFADLLVDKDDISKGVVDFEKLESYYAELTRIEV